MVLFNKFLRRDKKVVILGLDNAGKTSLIPYLQNGKYMKLEPEIEKEQSVLKIHDQKVNVVALSGKGKLRDLWLNEASKADLIIFVIDTQDPERYNEAREELWKLISRLNTKPFLILANKFDRQPISKIEEIRDALNLSQIPDYVLLPISCKTGFGIVDVYSKLYLKLAWKKHEKRTSIESLKIFNKSGLPLTTKNGYYCYDDVQKGKILTSIVAVIKVLYQSDLKSFGTIDRKFLIHNSKHFMASLILKTNKRQENQKSDVLLTNLLNNLERISSHLENMDLHPIETDFNLQLDMIDSILNIETIRSWQRNQPKNGTGAS